MYLEKREDIRILNINAVENQSFSIVVQIKFKKKTAFSAVSVYF